MTDEGSGSEQGKSRRRPVSLTRRLARRGLARGAPARVVLPPRPLREKYEGVEDDYVSRLRRSVLFFRPYTSVSFGRHAHIREECRVFYYRRAFKSISFLPAACHSACPLLGRPAGALRVRKDGGAARAPVRDFHQPTRRHLRVADEEHSVIPAERVGAHRPVALNRSEETPDLVYGNRVAVREAVPEDDRGGGTC